MGYVTSGVVELLVELVYLCGDCFGLGAGGTGFGFGGFVGFVEGSEAFIPIFLQIGKRPGGVL